MAWTVSFNRVLVAAQLLLRAPSFPRTALKEDTYILRKASIAYDLELGHFY